MKDIILYNYQIDLENIKEYKEYSVFEINNVWYYFTKLKRKEKEWEELLVVVEELWKKNKKVFPFIKNVYGSLVTQVENIPYVLVRVTQPNIEYGILEIIEYQKDVILKENKSALYRNEWGSLWSSKVDFFEYQVHELGKEYPIILNSFSYYVGLAENAISYVNKINKHLKKPNDVPIVLSHKRVAYPNISLNFDNPLNFIFDIEVRDIASYIKSLFFEDENAAWIDLITYIKLRKPSMYSLSMLYARLLYPSYYFDLHQKIIEKETKEESLLKIIDKIESYENFLKKAYEEFTKYAPIEPVTWLLKKESQ